MIGPGEPEVQLTPNKIRCIPCDETIESTHRHDFRTCSGGHVFVDGGDEYKRRGWPSGDPSDWYEEVE